MHDTTVISHENLLTLFLLVSIGLASPLALFNMVIALATNTILSFYYILAGL